MDGHLVVSLIWLLCIINISLQVFVWTHVSSFLEYVLRVESLDHCSIHLGICLSSSLFQSTISSFCFPFVRTFCFHFALEMRTSVIT